MTLGITGMFLVIYNSFRSLFVVAIPVLKDTSTYSIVQNEQKTHEETTFFLPCTTTTCCKTEVNSQGQAVNMSIISSDFSLKRLLDIPQVF
jgi:hypothetical protein